MYDQMDSLSLACFTLKIKQELLLTEKLFHLTTRNRRRRSSVFFSIPAGGQCKWWWWNSLLYFPRLFTAHVVQYHSMCEWRYDTRSLWGSLNECSNVFFCLVIRKVLDFMVINQALFHTLNMSLAFHAE